MEPHWILLIGTSVVLGSVLVLRLHAFLALLAGAIVVASLTSSEAVRRHAEQKMSPAAAKAAADKPVGERVALGFGSTATSIGILIALASIVGKCLMDSGAADRIVLAGLRLLGEPRAGPAMLIGGYVLGIPVFFDTVFYLMVPLAKTLAVRTGRNYLLYILAIAGGATMTHSLVPPTPGPLAAAALLKVDMGRMILGGCAVGIICAAFGYWFALWVSKRIEIPIRGTATEAPRLDEADLPPLWLSLVPVLLPVLLISADSVIGEMAKGAQPRLDPQSTLVRAVAQLGDKNVSLALAAVIAMATQIVYRKATREQMGEAVSSALTEAGGIILITSAGGAFGAVLQQTGIGEQIRDFALRYNVGVIPLAWGVTVLIRAAQGSATVAMITSAGIFAGMSDAASLGFDPVWLALAVGCGSKPFIWMNDSGFWVMSRMSGMTEGETLRTVTPMLTIMGVVGLIVVMIGAAMFPMV